MCEKQRKAEFVRTYLSPLLRHAGIEVAKAEYFVAPNGEEYVTVTYTNGYSKNICVSADSLRAIVETYVVLVDGMNVKKLHHKIVKQRIIMIEKILFF